MTFAVAALASLSIAAPVASAVVPETEVAGASAKWFSGSLLQQPGLNCSTAILGESYTEIMVSGIAAYGGAPGGGVPAVGQRYWTSFLISIPGNPCGPGSSLVQTELVLPPGTSVDPSAPIRCFGQPRNSNTFGELTGQSWSAFGGSGPYCPSAPGPAVYNQGALSFGYRPLASGQLFQIFVPVKSTQQLVGAGTSPADGFRWLTNATGVYANPGLSTVWANVFPTANSGSPFVYFQREAAIPFWNSIAPAGQENRVELFANLYSAGKAGDLCYKVVLISTGSQRADCTISPFNRAVLATSDPAQMLLQVVPGAPETTGQNGGYAPFWFDQPASPGAPDGEWNQNMRITWTFTPTSGGGGPVSASADFKTLGGKDADGDGVPDVSDACPAVKGTQSNGCLPTPEADPDKDGIYGASDLCPTVDGQGASNGCPGGVVPTPPVQASGLPPGGLPVKPLTGASALKRNALLKRTALGKGLGVKVTCSRDATASLSLALSAKVAKKLKLKLKRGAKSLVIATGSGACKAAGGATVKLKLGSSVKRKVLKGKGRVAATLSLRLTAPGATPVTSATSVKVG